MARWGVAMNIAICDDELTELETLRRLVEDYGKQRQLSLKVSCFSSGNELLSCMSQTRSFDIVFLDVFMGDSNGVLVARKIREYDTKCSIIFATNSRNHALEGFGVRALQYLLKPLDTDSLVLALDQAIEVQNAREPKVVHIKSRQGDYRILLEDIIYAESRARVITIHLNSQQDISFYERLDTFELQCQDTRFLRCHKSFLVNMDHIRSIANSCVILETGQEIPVSINSSRAKEIFASFIVSKI